jgi:hypothetical protein
MTMLELQKNGGTGVAPVKFGVTPNFVGGDGSLVH